MPKNTFLVSISHGKRTETEVVVTPRSGEQGKLLHLFSGDMVMTAEGLGGVIKGLVEGELQGRVRMKRRYDVIKKR